MRKTLRLRFWFELCMATLTTGLLVLTLVQQDWIEVIFSVDPDNHSGSLEWLIVGVLLVVTIGLFTLAGYEWRKTRTAIG
jgi:hypothetical protein